MQEAFGIVIFAVVLLGAVAALASLPGRGRAYEQIGRGGLSLDQDGQGEGGADGAIGASKALSERDEEILQMLTARSTRRAARGESGHDVQAELAELQRPGSDPALRDEVRDLVLARNARRLARGDQPLDVDAEIERQLSRF